MANVEIKENVAPTAKSIDISEALLKSATDSPLSQAALLRESNSVGNKTMALFPSIDSIMPQSIGLPAGEKKGVTSGDKSDVSTVDKVTAPRTEQPEPVSGKNDDKRTEWPKEPKPSEIFLGHTRNMQHAGELFSGFDPETRQRNQLAQRYLNSKEHLGGEPLTADEQKFLFANPKTKEQLDEIVNHDRPTPRFN